MFTWLRRGLCAALLIIGATAMAGSADAHDRYGGYYQQHYHGRYGGYGGNRNYGYGQGYGSRFYFGYSYGPRIPQGYGGYGRGYYGYGPGYYRGYGYCR